MSVACLAGGCGRLQFEQLDNDPDALDSGSGQIIPDGPPPVDPMTPWGPATRLSLTTAAGDSDPSATADLLEVYFTRTTDIYVMKRVDAVAPWGTPVIVAELSSAATESNADVSADGLELVMSSNRDGSLDIYRSTRATREDAWATPSLIPELAADYGDFAPTVSFDRLAILWATERTTPGNLELFEARRLASDGTWGPAVALTALNTTSDETSPSVTSDLLAVYYQSSFGGDDLWVARRSAPMEGFMAPEAIADLNTTNFEGDPWIAPDGRTILFISNRSGGQMHIFIATR